MRTSVPVLLGLASAMSISMAVEMRFYSQLATTTNHRYKKFTFSDAQVCYSLDSCYSNLAVTAAWSGAPTGAKFAFYDDSECSGRTVHITDSTSKASIDLSKLGFSKKVTSFMMWQWSKYPISGLKNICYESAVLATEVYANTSLLEHNATATV